MKTLGQIAWEVRNPNGMPLDRASKRSQEIYEEIGQAVRAVVIEECAKVCEVRGAEYWGSLNLMDPDCEFAECAKAIRSLK